MQGNGWIAAMALAVASLAGVASGLAAPSGAPMLPPPAGKVVSYSRDVKPILAHNCFSCHARDKRQGALSLDTRELVLRGGESGPAAVPGKSAESELIRRVVGHGPKAVMPPGGKRLTAEEVGILRAWIDQGLKWDVAAAGGPNKMANVLPRRPPIPPGTGNPIDRFLSPYFRQRQIRPTRVDDRTFARRVYLDAAGILPPADELAAFLNDSSPDRREQLVRKLLSDSERYANHWVTFWQDHLRDGIKDIGSTDVFRPITPWLYDALVANRPYDEFVTQLITAEPPSENLDEAALERIDRTAHADAEKKRDPSGFLLGQLAGLERPRGDQAWQVQAAQTIGQVFLGVQLKCATCHDSFIDDWTMDETWALASILSVEPLEAVRCELPTGRKPLPRFIFPQVGNVDPLAPRELRQKQLARVLTHPKNGRFARTIVNRLWAQVMGVGIVPAVDDMSARPWHPDLLDFLASDLVEHRYDLKRTLELILTSQAYQMRAVDEPTIDEERYVFRGPRLRRLTAEQFVDAVYALLNKPERAWKENGNRLMELLGRPDRRAVVTARDVRPSTIQALELLNGPTLFDWLYTDRKTVKLTADNAGKVQNAKPEAVLPNAEVVALSKLPPHEIADRISTRALSRPLSPRERALYLDLLGPGPTPESVADLLWVVIMLPEFQLIR